ncbi:MAG: DUF4394 domain-containing protein, partial [Hymenobacter sp.]
MLGYDSYFFNFLFVRFMIQHLTNQLKTHKSLLLSLLLVGGAALPAAAQTGYALTRTTSNTYSLSTFQATSPGTFTASVTLTGILSSNQYLIGMDFRPATGELYALGYALIGQQVQLYKANLTTGALTPVGSAQRLDLGTNPARIGFDFNPTADLIRVTGSNRVNLRLSPATGALAGTDTQLAYASTDPNANATPVVGSSAYTNSFIGTTTTVLYDIDLAASRLVTQNPPNAGTLNTVGTLGVNVSSEYQTSDLDIYYNPSTGQNVAYLSTSDASTSSFLNTSALYTVNLATGATTRLGTLGNNTSLEVSDIAMPVSGGTSNPVRGQLAYGLAGNNLVSFDTSLPGSLRSSIGITGVDATQTLAGLDVRPANNALYALGYNANAATGVANAQIYSINAVTGVATAAGPAVRLTLGTGSIGFDFDPANDRIRVVGANRNNYLLNPITGELLATGGILFSSTFASRPSIGAIAYSNSFKGATTTTSSTLYAYDEALNTLNTQATTNPIIDGAIFNIGASGITVNATVPTVDLDIYSTGVGVNTAYLVANTGTSANTSLYTVNLTTGAATLVGAIGNGLAVRDIAVAATTGVVTSNRSAEVATNFTLYPNPAASATSLSFGLPRAAHVELVVSYALGRTVDKVDAGQLAAGPQTLRWSRHGQAAGLYFFRLSFDGQAAGTRQVALT